MLKKPKTGFTLIELLAVIAIISLIATIALVGINNARAKARDAKRIHSLHQLDIALELYYLDNGEYPYWTGSGSDDGVCIEEGDGKEELTTALVNGGYINFLPKDLKYNSINCSFDGETTYPGGSDCFCITYKTNGRNRYKAFSKMEKDNEAAKKDGGIHSSVYEVYSKDAVSKEIAYPSLTPPSEPPETPPSTPSETLQCNDCGPGRSAGSGYRCDLNGNYQESSEYFCTCLDDSLKTCTIRGNGICEPNETAEGDTVDCGTEEQKGSCTTFCLGQVNHGSMYRCNNDGTIYNGEGVGSMCTCYYGEHCRATACGNSVCESVPGDLASEDATTCPRDCSDRDCSPNCIGSGNKTSQCNLDGTIFGSGEYYCTCYNSCEMTICGDGICETTPGGSEDETSCPQDCSELTCSGHCSGRLNNSYRCDSDGTYNGTGGEYWCYCTNSCEIRIVACSPHCSGLGNGGYACNLGGTPNAATGEYWCQCLSGCEMTTITPL